MARLSEPPQTVATVRPGRDSTAAAIPGSSSLASLVSLEPLLHWLLPNLHRALDVAEVA